MSPRVDVGRRAPPRLRAPPCLQAAPAARSEPARHRHRAGVVAHLERERERGLEGALAPAQQVDGGRSEEHTSELQSLAYLVCRLLLEKKKQSNVHTTQQYIRHDIVGD